MDELLEQILEECRPLTAKGAAAAYIPELAKVDKNGLGIYVLCSDGRHYSAGDADRPFTIQSVMKPILLLLALMDNGVEEVRRRIGVEATGKPFDAINVSDSVLSATNLNPMVNAGAILLCTLLRGKDYQQRFERLLALVRQLADDPTIDVDEDVYRSEKATGSKNRALAYLLHSQKMITDDVEEVLDCYFRACSIRVCSRDLAHLGYVLASHGRLPGGERLFPSEYAWYINATLTSCGMYDGSADFALRVGIPAKSGVGGGIMGVVPTRMGIGIYGPALDSKGNSLAGVEMLSRLSRALHLSIF